MPPQQVLRGFLHWLQIQRLRNLPDQPGVMRGRRAPHQQAKAVLPLNRGKPCVPVIGHAPGLPDRDGLRLQMIVQRLGQAERIPLFLQVAMGHLGQRVHPGIRPPCCGNRVRAGFKPRQSRLDRALNRGLIRLTLPPGKGRAVIFYR